MSAPTRGDDVARLGAGTKVLAVRSVLRYYWAELVRQPKVAVPGMVLPALGNVCILYLAPLLVGNLVGRLADGPVRNVGAVLPYVLGVAGALLAGEALWRVGTHFLNLAESSGMARLHRIAMRELLGKDVAFFHDNFAGSLTKRAVSFASRFEQFVDTVVFNVLGQVVPLGFACVVLWRYHPALVAVLLGLLALTGAVVAPLIRRRQLLVDKRETASARVAGHVADCVINMDTVRAFAAEGLEAAEHRARVEDYRRRRLRASHYGNLRIDILIAPFSVLTTVAGLLLAIWLADGGLGVAAIVVAFTYYSNATRIMFEFNPVYRRLESALTEAAQFSELLLDPPTVLDPPKPEPLRSGPADIRFQQVRFGYTAGRPLFEGLDLTVPDGATVGLVGRSGGGKSTITKLLLRMMDVNGGRILIGGQNIADLRQADLRSLIAYVPQDPAMFHRTLRENIAFARPAATEAEIRRAADAAHVTGFVQELSRGFDTVVGERGVKLSGGQRQRVAIARAILRDAPVLLLDEATSALDSENELLIQEALWELMRNRTTVAIAHRLSTVARMDRLIVLDRGRIVEQGTHHTLVESGGVYADLWCHQSGGFLAEPEPEPGPGIR